MLEERSCCVGQTPLLARLVVQALARATAATIAEHHAKKFPKPYFLQPKPLSPKTHGVFEDLDLYKA